MDGRGWIREKCCGNKIGIWLKKIAGCKLLLLLLFLFLFLSLFIYNMCTVYICFEFWGDFMTCHATID